MGIKGFDWQAFINTIPGAEPELVPSLFGLQLMAVDDATGAINLILPPQTGQAGKVLTTDGSSVSWETPSASGGGTWGSITGTLSAQTDLQSELDGKQAHDADLDAIAALTASNDDILQRKAGAWTNRTLAQIKTDLNLSGSNTGDQDLSGYQTKAGVLALGGFSSITGRIGNANLPLGVQLYDNAGTPLLSVDVGARKLWGTISTVPKAMIDWSADGTIKLLDGILEFNAGGEMHYYGGEGPTWDLDGLIIALGGGSIGAYNYYGNLSLVGRDVAGVWRWQSDDATQYFNNSGFHGVGTSLTFPGSLSIASGKTLTASNTLTLSGTDGSTLAIGTGGTLGSNAFTSTAYVPSSWVDTDGTLAANSDFKVATQKAVKTYVDSHAGGSTTKVYRAVMSQSGENAPTVTVMENSLGGTVVWTRDSIGKYIGTLVGGFTVNKTWLNACVNQNADIGAAVYTWSFLRTSADTVEIQTASSGDSADGGLSNNAIEILVYP